MLSLWAQRIVDRHACFEENALKVMRYALDRDMQHFDTAGHGRGQSEQRVGKVACRRRK